MKPGFAHSFVAFLLACNYFAFQVELFDEEYEANHPKPAERCSLSPPSLTWETFDKENAPQAFTLDPDFTIHFFFNLPNETRKPLHAFEQFRLVLDKSPPPRAQ